MHSRRLFSIIGLAVGPAYALQRAFMGLVSALLSLLIVTAPAYTGTYVKDAVYGTYIAALALDVHRERMRRSTTPPPSLFQSVVPPAALPGSRWSVTVVRMLVYAITVGTIPAIVLRIVLH